MKATMLLKKDHSTVSGLFKEFDRLGESAFKGRRDLFNQIRIELEVHARIEEELFYPELEKVSEAADLVKEAYREHQMVKDLLVEIRRLDPKDDDYVAKVEVLRENVEHHVEEEEGEIFPLAKKHLSTERLEKMGDQLEARRDELMKQMKKTEMA
jgi:hemerythrin-like domain-containing protein